MKKRPFDMARLAGNQDTIELLDRTFKIKGPDEFCLVPLAKVSLGIERLYTGLKLENPDRELASDQVAALLEKICPDLVDCEEIFCQLDLDDKLQVLDVFAELGRDTEAESEQELIAEEDARPAEPTDWFSVIPKLQKFYGGSPRDWFNLKLKWLKAYSEQMESLKAEFILDMSQAHLAGSWPTSEEQKNAIEQLINQLQALVDGIDNQDMSQEEIGDALSKIGFGVRVVEIDQVDMKELEDILGK